MTNKPEVQRYKLESGHDSVMQKVNQMQESEGGVYIRFDDYEALQAEYNQLKSYYKNGIDCFASPCEEHSGEKTPPFSEFFEKYGEQCLICVVDSNKELQTNYLKLTAKCLELSQALAESQANDRQAMSYLNQIREIVGGDDFPDMIERVGELYKAMCDVAPTVQGEPVARQPCPGCFETGPHTGTCGSSDPKALCNREPQQPAEQQPSPDVARLMEADHEAKE